MRPATTSAKTWSIVVEDERIKSVVSAGDVKIPSGANVIDLSHSTVLPGLIDCHTHLGCSRRPVQRDLQF